ncbi:MAG TPA: type II toxin-antitoxin system CcdA family antitoxin [Magnetospirillaceae bacterium]|nr:type II toxin-antitoxin system CcdA family antitoxin [Magnetospirillaceae bacterium]
MTQAAKRPINLKARDDLVTEAKALGINLSATFEAALVSAVKAAKIEKWQDENREAFAAYDKRVEAKGVFSAGKRRF